MPLPTTTALRLEPKGAILTAWLDDPPTRNALGPQMRADLFALIGALEAEHDFRALVLRGASGTFCSGGDLKAFNALTATRLSPTGEDPIAADNRLFGACLTRFNRLPLPTIALVEGAAFAGALGLLCVTDAVITVADARFAVSETTLGLVPAQIAPFLVQRIGLGQTRRLALTGARFNGSEARRLGIAHFECPTLAAAETTLQDVLAGVLRCAPGANAATKSLLLDAAPQPTPDLLDRAARAFAESLRGEGTEGTAAFAQKRPPAWAA